MRINKYIAQAGIASRRKADELIANGNVFVNGLALKEPGYDVKEGDVVEVNGRRIAVQEKKIYLALHKPAGCVTTVKDDLNRPTVMDLLSDVEGRVFPVGRLDYNTSGLLIVTNDGDFAYKLTHPKHQMTKTYRARVAGILSAEKCAKLRKGVDIGGFVTSPAKVEIIKAYPGRPLWISPYTRERTGRFARCSRRWATTCRSFTGRLSAASGWAGLRKVTTAS